MAKAANEPKLSPAMMEKILKGVKQARDREFVPDPRDQEGKQKTGVDCKIPGCGGVIIKEVYSEYRGDPMQMVIGIGARKQMTRVTEIYCQECGISYHHMPKKAKAKKK